MWVSEEEVQPLLVPAPAACAASRLYRRRWLILAAFSLLGFVQGLLWNSWGPIQNSAKQALGFSTVDITLLVLWGPIGFLPCFILMWLMDKKGLRLSVVLTALLMTTGALLRCVPIDNQTVKKWLIHIGQLLNGFAGPVVINAPPFLSTTWFPPDQRATATAVASLFNYFGAACAFLVGPLIVPAPNGTTSLLTASNHHIDFIKGRIQTLLYAEFGATALLLVVLTAYFPSQPPLPPSIAAASQRLNYRNSIYRLLSNFRFLMIALAFAMPLGILAGWSGVLDVILTPLKVSQVDAGWIGFWSTIGGCVVGIMIARFADFFRGVLKLILLLLFSGATLSSAWVALTCFKGVTHLPVTPATLYTSCILVGVFITSSVPFFFELLVETVYPVPEGITCGFVTFLSNVFMGLLLMFLAFYHTDVYWLNWCLTASCLFSLLLILLFKESYDRLYLDVLVSV
ncbi:solute carrier family 49 member 4 isoform X1 [Carcharodon carcharias]|uniref:solute carrier family 49 member 4 isoform X1 n=1 Tax=Carcharodon carcharias TaxID=13397 RepID=UPI001B7F02F8|nr:solute carrier family 49 member 4 isoform X1 [Carcharodon carcharias]